MEFEEGQVGINDDIEESYQTDGAEGVDSEEHITEEEAA